MEVCGSIFTNTDYSEFVLKCIYCSIENELKHWEQFMWHIQNAHACDDADVDLYPDVDADADTHPNANAVAYPDADGEAFSYLDAHADSYTEAHADPGAYPDAPTYLDAYTDRDSLKSEFVDTHGEEDNYGDVDNYEMDISIKAGNWPEDDLDFDNEDIFEKDAVNFDLAPLEYPPTAKDTDEKFENTGVCVSEGESGGEETEILTDCQLNESSDESDVYVNEEETSSSESEECDETPPKRSRTNPMTLKRKLKVSFARHNPRIVHLIEEYRKHSCLWNPTHPKYGDDKAQAEAYMAITEMMDKKANVLFMETGLKKSIQQLRNQYETVAQLADKKKLAGMPALYYNRCKFLSVAPLSTQSDDEEFKSDVIQLNFKEINQMTTTFIDIYANYPVLYDSSLSDFKSIDARSQAYINMSRQLAPEMRVNETEVHLAVMRLRKWAYMSLRRVKSKVLRKSCNKSELHYLQLCSFLPPKMEAFVVNCQFCDKRFFIDYSLRAHMVTAHNVGELPYLCSQCPRRFAKAHDMERHKLRMHCEKSLRCEYCNSAFSLKNDLTVHRRIHTGEKPFVCEICGKNFRLKLLLDYHINGCHLDLRPFECDLCPKKFRKRVQLKNHMKAHLNIRDKICRECGAAFSCPTTLCRHRKTHHSKANTTNKL